MKLLLPLLLLWSFTGFAKGKIDPQTVPGTVKWLCRNFEVEMAGKKFSSCGQKDQSRENAYHQCLEVLNSGVGQKRFKFIGPVAQQCVDKVKLYMNKPGQEARAAMMKSCADVVRGGREKGEACESPLDCQQGFACIGVKGQSPGKCAKQLSEDEGCDTDLLGASAFIALLQESRPVCEAGLVCSETLGKPRVCAKPAKTSEPAFGGSQGSACRDSGQCKGVCENGKCQAVCGSG